MNEQSVSSCSSHNDQQKDTQGRQISFVQLQDHPQIGSDHFSIDNSINSQHSNQIGLMRRQQSRSNTNNDQSIQPGVKYHEVMNSVEVQRNINPRSNNQLTQSLQIESNFYKIQSPANNVESPFCIQDLVNDHINLLAQHEDSQTEQTKLNSQLLRQKLFLNMVIHDMRNPTSSIKAGLNLAIDELSKIQVMCKDQKNFSQKCQDLNSKFSFKQDKKSLRHALNQMNSGGLFKSANVKINPNNIIANAAENQEEKAKLVNLKVLYDDIKSHSLENSKQFAQIQDQSSRLLDFVKKAAMEENRDQDQEQLIEYEDFDEEDLDEGFFQIDQNQSDDQIIQNPPINNEFSFNLNRQKIEQYSLETQESKTFDFKKKSLTEDIRKLLSKYQIDQQFKKNKRIESFVDEIVQNQASRTSKIEQNEMVNFKTSISTQTDFQEKPRQNMIAMEDIKLIEKEVIKLIENLVTHKDLIQSQNISIYQKLDILQAQNEEYKKQVTQQEQKTKSENKYYSTIFQQIKGKVKESENILQRFKFSQQMMENLINDLLDLAKLENNQFSITNENFNLQTTIFQSLQMLQFIATQNGVELKAVIDNRIHLNLIQSVIGDERRYLQIFLNFLSNALKFTDQGGCITIKVDILDNHLVNENLTDRASNQKTQETPLKEGQQRYLKLKISVIDTGIGISEQGLKHLFIDFSKLTENSKRNQQGTGLGLSICKKIIEQMGGSVLVKSKLGQGSEFILNMNCLCVVKMMKNTQILETSIQRQNIMRPRRNESAQCKLKSAMKIEEQIVFIQKLRNQDRVQMCFKQTNENACDLSNPTNSQLEGTEKIQKRGFLNYKHNLNKELRSDESYSIASSFAKQYLSNAPMLQQSHDEIQDLINSCESQPPSSIDNQNRIIPKRNPKPKAKEQDKCLNKSRKQELMKNLFKEDNIQKQSKLQMDLMSYALNSDQIQQIDVQESNCDSPEQIVEQIVEKTSQISDHLMPKFKCLIANDEPMQLYVINSMFQRHNISTNLAQNGCEAYNMVLKSMQDKNNSLFDLIVLDLNMPISNGFETCKNILQKYDDRQIFMGDQSRNQKPLIVACTSDVIDEEMRKNLNDIGFDLVFQAPISDSQIVSQILPNLEKRQQGIKLQKNNMQRRKNMEMLKSQCINSSGNSKRLLEQNESKQQSRFYSYQRQQEGNTLKPNDANGSSRRQEEFVQRMRENSEESDASSSIDPQFTLQRSQIIDMMQIKQPEIQIKNFQFDSPKRNNDEEKCIKRMTESD